jgi:hypothetical protein
MQTTNMFSNELPSSGGLPRFSEIDIYEASTPRPGAQSAHQTQHFVPLLTRSNLRKKKDSTIYRFQTNPKFVQFIKNLDDLVAKGKDLSLYQFGILKSAMMKQYIKIDVGPRMSTDQHKLLIEEISDQLLKLSIQIHSESDPIKIQELQTQQIRKKSWLKELQEVPTRIGREPITVVPHKAKIHSASAHLFRDILSHETLNKEYVSTKALMAQVMIDLETFLTCPRMLKNRISVFDQIMASIPVKRHNN